MRDWIGLKIRKPLTVVGIRFPLGANKINKLCAFIIW